MEDLESQLQQGKDARLKLIVSDGAFSMDGKIAPLKQLLYLFIPRPVCKLGMSLVPMIVFSRQIIM